MKWIIIILVFFTSCAPVKYVPIKGDTVVITKTEYIPKDSLIYIKVPDESVKNRTTDTTSFLETCVAKSNASIRNGRLNHTLENKKDSLRTRIEWKEKIVVDSVMINQEIPVEVIIEKPIRDNIFWYSIIGNVVFIALLGFKFARIIKKFISL